MSERIDLQVGIVFVRKWRGYTISELFLVLLHDGLIDLDSGWRESRFSHKFLKHVSSLKTLYDALTCPTTHQALVADQFPGKPQEGLFKVVV